MPHSTASGGTEPRTDQRIRQSDRHLKEEAEYLKDIGGGKSG